MDCINCLNLFGSIYFYILFVIIRINIIYLSQFFEIFNFLIEFFDNIIVKLNNIKIEIIIDFNKNDLK